jgi:hypothetical protein
MVNEIPVGTASASPATGRRARGTDITSRAFRFLTLRVARTLISNVVDVRDPVQIAHDQIARRAETMLV